MRKPEPHVSTTDGTVTYRVRFRDGRVSPRNGQPVQTSETFGTEKDALRFAALLQRMTGDEALRQLDLESRTHGGPTLDEVAARHFDWKATRVRSDRTVADYRRDYDNWVSPVLGRRRASTVTGTDVQQLVDSMHGRLSAKSIADRHAILFGIFKWASAPSRRIVEDNPCVGTELPKRHKTQPKGLRPAEWQALHAALTSIDADAADLAEFLLATGWRFSEAAALSAFDTEDDGRTVTVSMGRVVRRNAAGEHVIVDDAKSAAGLRRVKLDADASAMVRRRLERVTGNGLLFTTAKGSQWHSSNFSNRCWKPAVKAANLGRNPTPHWLRHTSVAWLVLGGKVSLPEIQRRIGHEHISTTIDVYGRMIEDVSAEALDGFAAMRRAGGKQVRPIASEHLHRAGSLVENSPTTEEAHE